MAAGKWFGSWLGRSTGRWPTGGERSEPTGHQRDIWLGITMNKLVISKYYILFNAVNERWDKFITIM